MLPPSAKLYLARALYDWCIDHGLTPYVSAKVEGASVPRGYDQDGVIVLNLGPEATNRFAFEPDGISFQARFGGKVFDVWLPAENVLAIYARETGHGIALPDEMFTAPEPDGEPTPPEGPEEKPSGKRGGGFLRVVK